MARHSLSKSLFGALFSLLAIALSPTFNVTAAQGGSLEEGLIAHYELNGEGTDSGPNDLHGVPVGPIPTPTTGANGAANGACLFEGGYFEVEDDSVLTLGADDFTIATWLRYTTLGDFQIMGHNEGSGTHNKWILMASPDGIKFHVFSPPTPLEYPINWTGWSPVVNTWYHVCVRRSGDTYKLFVNGIERASGSSSLSLSDVNAPLRIGTSEGSAFAGALDEVRIYSRALTDSEIGSISGGIDLNRQLIVHYPLNGDGTDSGPNGLDGVPVGPNPTPTTDPNGNVNGACLFEGGYFEVEDDSVLTLGADDFTIATWLRYTTLGDFQIMGHNEGSGTHNKWILMASPDGIKFHVFSPPTPLEYPINWTGWSPVVNTWYHVCVRRSGDTYKLFVNGIERASGSSSLSLSDVNAPLRIGTSEGSAFAGALDEVRIYSRALLDQEVDLLASGDPVIRYCSPAASNSVSATGARIETATFPSISNNQMILECHQLPPEQFGVFFFGPFREHIPFGDGYRCVGGPLKRIGLPINTGSGAVSLQFDFTSPPLDQISPGDRFNFQFWYRDPQPVGYGHNLSDALEITFCP